MLFSGLLASSACVAVDKFYFLYGTYVSFRCMIYEAINICDGRTVCNRASQCGFVTIEHAAIYNNTLQSGVMNVKFELMSFV